ncbi:Metallopeptidase M24 family protein [Rhynchospora pubera]|uniref:Xaa-Pro dipeptidase n=1 Tax=Rhynchospora pubera TaxID=906938 RepID=A0AAV8CW71_9POAL|nr:Metallopeptidase M24 family protein [Rhynchospora pubera]
MASPPSSSTLSPPVVPMDLHVSNRRKLLDSLRHHFADSSRPSHGFVLLQGGEEQTRYCTDHIELFRQESYFTYLFGVREPGFYGAIDISTGKSILFAPRLPADYAVWLGEIKPLSYFQESYMVDLVYYVDELKETLENLFEEKEKKPLLFLLHGLNTDSNNYSKPAKFEGMENFEIDLTTLHPILTECRVLKTEQELAIIQYANDVSSEAHIQVMRNAKVGMKEYQLESIFLHHIYMYGGCRHCSYTCICATGHNSSVLHYGHAAAPNDKILEDGDMALMDMGAEYSFYGSDITCSFPINGKFTKDQTIIYNGLERPTEPGLRSLRTVRELQNGMVITVEPGCYFIEALLKPASENPATAKFFNHEKLEKFKKFGGVRIESDVCVTADGCRNMTNCPRETWEIEAVMAGAPWPLKQ